MFQVKNLPIKTPNNSNKTRNLLLSEYLELLNTNGISSFSPIKHTVPIRKSQPGNIKLCILSQGIPS